MLTRRGRAPHIAAAVSAPRFLLSASAFRFRGRSSCGPLIMPRPAECYYFKARRRGKGEGWPPPPSLLLLLPKPRVRATGKKRERSGRKEEKVIDFSHACQLPSARGRHAIAAKFRSSLSVFLVSSSFLLPVPFF